MKKESEIKEMLIKSIRWYYQTDEKKFLRDAYMLKWALSMTDYGFNRLKKKIEREETA